MKNKNNLNNLSFLAFYLFSIFTTKPLVYYNNNKDNCMRIGILTSGEDCPGINSAIRSICKPAMYHYQVEIIGILNGFEGLKNKDIRELSEKDMSGLLYSEGSILGTSREKPIKKKGIEVAQHDPKILKKSIEELQLDSLICIGGNGTISLANKLTKLGANIIVIPKTIDNDIPGTDISFGFDSAVSIATEAIDRLHSTASSHKRAMVIEVMGDKAGWIALYAGMASGGDIILIPEASHSINNIGNTMIERLKRGKNYSIIVVAEGVKTINKKRAASYIAEEIEYETGFETRETVLGYIQRGGAPTPFDRNLATRMGGYAINRAMNKDYGKMIALQGDKIVGVPFEEIADKIKLVPKEHELIVRGKQIGVCFG